MTALAIAVRLVFGYITPEQAIEHVAAAELAAFTYGVEPELLLAIADHESRFTSDARRGRACGAMQVMARSAAHCRAMEITLLSYSEGGRMLRAWTDAADGDARAGLRGYACGGLGLRRRSPRDCHAFAAMMIGRAAKLRRAAQS